MTLLRTEIDCSNAVDTHLTSRRGDRLFEAFQTGNATMRWRITSTRGWRRFLTVRWTHAPFGEFNHAHWKFVRGDG